MLKDVFILAWTTFHQSLTNMRNHATTPLVQIAWIFFALLVIWAIKETHYIASVVIALIKEEIRWRERNKFL